MHIARAMESGFAPTLDRPGHEPGRICAEKRARSSARLHEGGRIFRIEPFLSGPEAGRRGRRSDFRASADFPTNHEPRATRSDLLINPKMWIFAILSASQLDQMQDSKERDSNPVGPVIQFMSEFEQQPLQLEPVKEPLGRLIVGREQARGSSAIGFEKLG
jgi:hypothetical protein